MKKAAIIGVLDAIGIEWRGLPYQQWVVLNETQDIRLILWYGNFIHLIDAFKKNILRENVQMEAKKKREIIQKTKIWRKYTILSSLVNTSTSRLVLSFP